MFERIMITSCDNIPFLCVALESLEQKIQGGV